MSTTVDPVILGPIMVIFLVLWFAWVSLVFREPEKTPAEDSPGTMAR